MARTSSICPLHLSYRSSQPYLSWGLTETQAVIFWLIQQYQLLQKCILTNQRMILESERSLKATLWTYTEIFQITHQREVVSTQARSSWLIVPRERNQNRSKVEVRICLPCVWHEEETMSQRRVKVVMHETRVQRIERRRIDLQRKARNEIHQSRDSLKDAWSMIRDRPNSIFILHPLNQTLTLFNKLARSKTRYLSHSILQSCSPMYWKCENFRSFTWTNK